MAVKCRWCGCSPSVEWTEGWESDHAEVCQLAPVCCPSKGYGCPVILPRHSILGHLANCPVGCAPCPFSKTCWWEEGPRWIFDPKRHIRYDHHTRKCSVVGPGRSCCEMGGGLMRRIDLSQHFAIAHRADFNSMEQGCPFSAGRPSFSLSQGNERSLAKALSPASPLHPPIQVKRKPELSRGNDDKGGHTSRPWASTDPTLATELCPFSRQRLEPIFPCHFFKNKSGTATNESAAADVFDNVDIVVKIFLDLECELVRMAACINTSSRDASKERCLRHLTQVVHFEWDATRSQFGATSWAPTLRWTKPQVSPPVLGWRLDFKCGCIAQHMQGCNFRNEVRSLDDMAHASSNLRDALGGTSKQAQTRYQPRVLEVGLAPKILKAHEMLSNLPRREDGHPFIIRPESIECAGSELFSPSLSPEQLVFEFFGAVMSQDVEKLEALLGGGEVTHEVRNAGGYTAVELARERGKNLSLSWLMGKGFS